MARPTTTLSLIAAGVFLTSCASVPTGNAESGYHIYGFVGENSQTAAPGTTVLLVDGSTGKAMATDQADLLGKFDFSGLPPGHYQLKVGEIVQDIVIGAENVRRDIDLSNPNGSMNYAAAATKQLAAGATGTAQPAGPNDEELARQIAGTWWGYEGSTETKIGLCPDGSYTDFRESGYSGTMHDAGGTQTGAWGTASQSGGQGVWTIQGTTDSGTISVRYSNGNSATIAYRQCGESGCLLFDGRKLCRTSAQCE
jgi:hypothetical protein